MSYEVLARKWRPRQFEDVVGQGHVTQTLKNAITINRIAHAYLFVGPRGIGKTSLARIFAKALNCAKGPSATPCDKCDSCLEITAGNSLDVLEIDGASNNGVEQVRELRETVKYAPSKGKYKIYIIDEVHMLSTAAFNALLKTLEEPPPHVKFIFATTEPEKILPTILSRCQRFDLKRISVPLIVERLKLIAKEEKIKIDDDALLAVARGAEGGLRDAESALDQLVSFKGNQIAEADVLAVFGLAARNTLEKMADSILKGEIKSVIEVISGLDEAGKDLQRFVVELMGHFRNLLVWVHVKDATGMELLDAQVETLKAQAALTDSERLLRIVGILAETEDRMRYALSKRTLLETALIRCARASKVVSIEEILAQLNKLKAGLGLTVVPASRSPVNSYTEQSASKRVEDAGRAVVGESANVYSAKQSVPTGGANRVEAKAAVDVLPEGDDELGMLLDGWQDIVEKVGKMAVGTKSLLVDARPLAVEENKVIIGFDPEFADEIERLEVSRNRKSVEHVLGSILKRPVTAVFKVSEGMQGPVPAERLAAKPKAPQSANGGNAKGQTKTKQDWINDPAVQKALDMFDGNIMDIRE